LPIIRPQLEQASGSFTLRWTITASPLPPWAARLWTAFANLRNLSQIGPADDVTIANLLCRENAITYQVNYLSASYADY
jgi:hypothetical protein